jgi:hypothetical protein
MSEHPVSLAALAQPRVSRRAFLKGSGVLVGTLWASSSVLLALAPSPSWALELKSLDQASATALLHFCRRIFPHDKLDDAVYALVVKELDEAAAKSAETRSLLAEGVAGLNRAAGGNWAAAPVEKKDAITASLAGTPFFRKVQGTAVVALYNNELAFAHFGYEGNAFQQGGGYLMRGFNDLKWLPNPTALASPAAFGV